MGAADDGNTTAVLQRLALPAGHLGSVTSLYVVPNVVHFIWFSDGADKKLTFINYVSILSAHRIQKPDGILLHCNHLPAGPWWERLWREVSRVTRVEKLRVTVSRAHTSVTETGVWRTGMSTLPAAPPIKYVLG